MRIHLFLLGYKALKCLQAIPNNKMRFITHITIGRDKNVQDDYARQIMDFCIENNLNYSERNQDVRINADYLIAIGWRWLLKKEACYQRIIVFHDSILPKYRGFNPLVTALINGDKRIGVTALFGADEIDSGAIISQWATEIEYPLKIKEAIEIVANGYGRLFAEVIHEITLGNELKGEAQPEKEATYSVWRDRKDYFIDWKWSACKIKRFVDAVGYPYLGARIIVDKREIIVDDVEVFRNYYVENPGEGKILFKHQGCPYVICGDGLVKLLRAKDLSGKPYVFPPNLRLRLDAL